MFAMGMWLSPLTTPQRGLLVRVHESGINNTDVGPFASLVTIRNGKKMRFEEESSLQFFLFFISLGWGSLGSLDTLHHTEIRADVCDCLVLGLNKAFIRRLQFLQFGFEGCLRICDRVVLLLDGSFELVVRHGQELLDQSL